MTKMVKRRPLSQLTLSEDGSVSNKRARLSEEDSSGCEKRAGTITYMTLKNFMCHSLLEVNFTNNVSFIIGRNGSGKSAILTALIVGLGGKASLTNRGTSVKGFVKAGKTSASVEIQLRNEGPMAYRPNVYGKAITVIRNFSASGTGNYRIKSASGAVISTQAKEIQNITASLNIQVDNPVCLLNQDTSREFLNSNDPKQKYLLFMKATNLETLSEEYKKIWFNKRESVRILTEKEQHYKKLQDEIKRLARKIEGHKSIINLRDKKSQLQLELLWAKVSDAENELEELKSKAERLQKKHDEIKENAEKRVERINEIKENIRELEQQIYEIKQAIEVQMRPQHDIKRILEELQQNLVKKRQQKQKILLGIQNKTKDVEYLKEEIEKCAENTSRLEQEKAKREKQLSTLEDKLKSVDDHLQTSRNDLYQIKSDVSRKEEEEQNLKREISQIDVKIAGERSNLTALEREKGNQLLLYGRDMPRVKQMIEQYQNRFTQLPRGPLGSYIKLKDKKWAAAIEGHLGKDILTSFVVDNNKDNKLLREIFNKVWNCGRQPTIITTKFIFKNHDIARHMVQAPSDCVSLYNALEIDDVVVSNTIIDQSKAETLLLIPSSERAMELLSHRENVPRNCAQGITIKGDKFYPDPNYKFYAARNQRVQFLQVDTKQHMQELQKNINKLTVQKQAITNQLQSFRNDLREQITKKDELEEKVRKLNFGRSQVRKQLEDLRNVPEPEVPSVENLESELAELKNSLTEENATLAGFDDDVKGIEMSITENNEKLKKLKASTKVLEERILPLQDQIRENTTKHREISTSEEFDKRKIEGYGRQLIQVRAEIVMKQDAVQRYTNQANNVGERLEELRNVCDIASDLKEVERSIAKLESDSDNVDQVVDRYNELHKKYTAAKDYMQTLKADVKELTSAVEMRKNHYDNIECSFIYYIKQSFKEVLEFRQFKGNIVINTEEKKLELVVIPQQGSQGHTTTSNLSGGERSFSTVAFLYSLWHCMEFPFYFLDEFDVYMDKLNRTKVIEILLHHAGIRPHLQFVFLTPQDISFLNKSDVSLLRLEDPKRFNL